jgi:hypothetical protein
MFAGGFTILAISFVSAEHFLTRILKPKSNSPRLPRFWDELDPEEVSLKFESNSSTMKAEALFETSRDLSEKTISWFSLSLNEKLDDCDKCLTLWVSM